jgi:hypothetical protein
MKRLLNGNSSWFYLSVILVFYLMMGLFSMLPMDPSGIHFVRQSDSLSFASHYYHFGMDFFHPGLFNLQSEEAKAACEFPILYYLSALIYFLVGEESWVLRSLTLLISTLGFLALFKTLELVFRNKLIPTILGLWFLTSTVLLYYSASFLPDASALGLCLMGWYAFARFWLFDETKDGMRAFVFFAAAGLLKVSFLIHPFAAFGFLFLHHFLKAGSVKEFMRVYRSILLVFGSGLLLVVLWNVYVLHFNDLHHDDYFLTHPRPIWNLNGSEVKEVWNYMSSFWRVEYYYMSTWHAFFILIALGAIFIWKKSKALAPLFILITLGSLSYFLLFYAQFKDHDYYILNLLPVLFLWVTAGVYVLREAFKNRRFRFLLPSLLVIITVLSGNYAHKKLTQRKEHQDPVYASAYRYAQTLKPHLDDLGIDTNTRVLSIGDQSRNGSLLALGRKGWTISEKEVNETFLMPYINQDLDFIVVFHGWKCQLPKTYPLVFENEYLRVYRTP